MNGMVSTVQIGAVQLDEQDLRVVEAAIEAIDRLGEDARSRELKMGVIK